MRPHLAEAMREHARKIQHGDRRVWTATRFDEETGTRYFASRLAEPSDWNGLYDVAEKLIGGNKDGEDS